MAIAKELLWIAPALLAAVAGWKDLRTRRIPNWLTVPGLVLGIVLASILRGWSGAMDSLLGAGLGLLLLLPFVVAKGVGMGDLKFVIALGALLGTENLMAVLFLGVLVNGLMALVLVIWRKRVLETTLNVGRMLRAFLTFQLPGPELTLDNPHLIKVPFGVALALAVLLYTVRRALGMS